MDFCHHSEARRSSRRKQPLAVNVKLSDAFMVVLAGRAIAKLREEAVSNRGQLLGSVTAKSDIHVERQSVVVAMLRDISRGTLKMTQFDL
jgi:hypothetical protein